MVDGPLTETMVMGFEIVMVSCDALGWTLALMEIVPPLATALTPEANVSQGN